MTSCAHGVPGHATTGPMSPFTGPAVFLSVHVEPVPAVGIERQFGALECSAWSGNEELSQGIDADYPIGDEGLIRAAETQRRNLKFFLDYPDLRSIGDHDNVSWRVESESIHVCAHRALGQCVMRSC